MLRVKTCREPGNPRRSFFSRAGGRLLSKRSCMWRDNHYPLTVCRIRQNGANIFLGEHLKIPKNFFLAHPGSEHLKHITNRDAHTANDRLAAAPSRLHSDDAFVILFPEKHSTI